MLLSLLPAAAGLIYAFGYSTGMIGALSAGFTGEHWNKVFSAISFWYSLGFSLAIGLISIAIATVIAMLLVIRYRASWLQSSKRYVISLPLVFPAIVTAFVVLQWFGKGGLAARICYKLGIIHDARSFPDMVNDKWGIGLILAHVLMATPFFTLLFANIYKANRMDEYEGLSASLGATKQQFYCGVLMPVLLKLALPNLSLYVIFAMGSYEIPLLLGRSYPQMVSVYAADKLMRFNLMDKPQAYVVVIIFTILVMFAVTYILSMQKKNSNEKG